MLSKKGAPLYYQAENYIREKIAIGEWREGSQIPTEMQLMQLFGISRVTLRHAISDLVNEGLLECLQGQGTFVKNHVSYINDPTQIFIESSSKDTHKVLSAEMRTASADECEKLAIPAGSQLCVIRYLHFRPGAEKPHNFSVSCFPQSRYPDIEKQFGSTSIHAISKEIYGLPIKYAISSVTAISLDEEVAGHFATAVNIPAIKIEKIYYSAEDRPLMLTDLSLNPNNSKMQLKPSWCYHN